MEKRGQALMALWGKRLLYLDGGMGTQLQAMGLGAGEQPERWNLRYPGRVKGVHAAYLKAGCDVVTANSFGASREQLGRDAEDCMAAAVRIARQAVEEAGRGWVALDIGGLGRLLRPYGDMPFEEAVTQFRDAARAGLSAGADLALIETMTDLLEAKAAVLGVQEAMGELGLRVPLFCSLTFEEKGRLLTGADIRGTAAMLCGLGVDAVGLNCGDRPRALLGNARELLRWCPRPVFVSPNASLPVVVDGTATFPATAEEFAREMREMAGAGVWGLGGCCGTTPSHIEAMIAATRETTPAARSVEKACVVSGRSASAVFGDRPLLIGERLNPTGKPLMKRALRENNMDYLLREAVAQAEAGADALDVNVGLPEVEEEKMLAEAVTAIQSVCDLPLQIDTANPRAMEAALRVYAGKPLINSVSGKKEALSTVLPLAARYGGAVVALLLDDEGIPATVEGRLAIARRIMETAAEAGVDPGDLIFDALTLPVSTDGQAARTTLETMGRLRKELGAKTILGVSNVSFGLPQRPFLTAAFTAMAIGEGLSAAIINPLDDTVRGMVIAAAAISGRDQGFGHYLSAYGGEKARQANAGTEAASGQWEGKTQPAEAKAASGAIEKGLCQEAVQQVKALLEGGMEPLAVVEEIMMPALGQVGERYEQGTLFLPQLLQCARAAQAAFEEIRARLPEEPADPEKKVLLATVHGDVHDIGKNIVKVLLQNYGFTVEDLGRDVPPQRVLDAVKETGARVVGLSALMTTTTPAMAETIRLLRREAPQVKVMVGGAVLTEEYAGSLGADGYGKDAMAAVRLAEKLCAGGRGERTSGSES